MVDADGTQKDPFEDRRKDRVAGIDRVLNVTELVRQADLPFLGPIALSTQKSGRTSPRNAAGTSLPLRMMWTQASSLCGTPTASSSVPDPGHGFVAVDDHAGEESGGAALA